MKTLTFVKRGCNYTESDIGSYRISTQGNTVKGKDGRLYWLDISRWDRHTMRYTNKRTGAQLKHPVWERVNANALCLDTEYEEKRAGNDYTGCYRNITLEKEIHALNFNYTKADVLKVVNLISAEHYDAIKIIE